jgi:hypothetical protein
MMTESQKLCLEIIESVYLDGVDAIGQPVVEGDQITCQFQDGDKVLLAKIYPDREENDIEISMVSS